MQRAAYYFKNQFEMVPFNSFVYNENLSGGNVPQLKVFILLLQERNCF